LLQLLLQLGPSLINSSSVVTAAQVIDIQPVMLCCADRRALASLAAAAEAAGHPEWGYAGPHDSGGYNSLPLDTDFFKPHGGSWDTGKD